MAQDAQSWLNAVQAMLGAGELDAAERACRARLAELNEDADALHVLAWVLDRKQDRAGADDAIRRAIVQRPNDALLYNTQSAIFAARGEFDSAEASARRAIELRPDFLLARLNLGDMQYNRGHLDEAINTFSHAAAVAPGEAKSYISMAAVLAAQGRHADVLNCCRRAIELAPNRADLYHHLLYYMWFSTDVDRHSLVSEHQKWGQMVSVFGLNNRPHENGPDPERKIRVGYVSPDLRSHPIGYFMAPILAAHDQNHVEVFCYYHGPRDAADALLAQLQRDAPHWVNTHHLDDDQLAERIRADQIDVLIDLSLHMALNRLILFTRKPAPVQATYLSYPGTSGLPQMDYRVTDQWMEPADRVDGWLGPEKLARLERCYWCYRVPPEAPEVAPPPFEKNGYITFACTNNFMKVTDPAIALWAEILKRVPGARLRCFIRGGAAHNFDSVETFADAGIDRERVELLETLPYGDYLRAYGEIDVALDPFPYNGGTTTFDSLYMGVPVITLAGELPVGRFGLTIMQNLDLPELVATTPDEYVERAVALAKDRDRLRLLRSTLRPRLANSHLTGARQFTRQLEALYRMMWRQWCSAQRG
ncbi:MAG TPA: tetratricopeptide repeat protein [Tepidisphaeraceae bacterium]|jgi:tetratricopeptide (TPR) repeat protein